METQGSDNEGGSKPPFGSVMPSIPGPKNPAAAGEVKQDPKNSLMSINFGLNQYGRLKYLIEMTQLRKRDKRELIYASTENLPEKKLKASEERRMKIEEELKLKLKELKRYDEAFKEDTKGVVSFA
jgi:hypothetical protein